MRQKRFTLTEATKNAKLAETKMLHTKARFHVRRIEEAREAGRMFEVEQHEKAFRECEKKLGYRLPQGLTIVLPVV